MRRYHVDLKPGYSAVDHLFLDYARHMRSSYGTARDAIRGYWRSAKRENRRRKACNMAVCTPPSAVAIVVMRSYSDLVKGAKQ